MAAHRHGMREAIIPRENEKDLPDIPDTIRQTMKLSFVDSMDEVLKIALERDLVALVIPTRHHGRGRAARGRDPGRALRPAVRQASACHGRPRDFEG